MSEFEDKLNALLSSPESMAQVAELAKQLSAQNGGSVQGGGAPQDNTHAEAERQPPPPQAQSQAKTETPDLSSLLGGIDPNMIAQIASMFTGGGGTPKSSPSQASAPSSGSASPLSSLLGGIDAKTISRFLPILAQLNDGRQDERAQLLYALRPFLKPERQDKVDRALQLARLFRAGKLFLKGLGENNV